MLETNKLDLFLARLFGKKVVGRDEGTNKLKSSKTQCFLACLFGEIIPIYDGRCYNEPPMGLVRWRGKAFGIGATEMENFRKIRHVIELLMRPLRTERD